MASRLSSQAQINAVLRYAPQRQALAALVREAHAEHDATVEGAESAGRLTANAVAGAAPRVAGIYDRAQASSSAARQQLGSVLASLGASGAPQASAAAAEGAQGAEKTARERGTAETDLASQALAAAQAPQFAQTVANSQLARTLSKLRSTAEGIAGQEGLATASEIERQEKEARGEALTKRGQDITAQSDKEGHELTAAGQRQSAQQHHEDLAQAKQLAEEKGEISLAIHGAKGPNGNLPLKEQTKARGFYGNIYNEAKGLKEKGHNAQAIIHALLQPLPSTTKEAADGSKETIAGHKGWDNNGLLHAAVEEVVYGGVSSQTLSQVRGEGWEPRRFGLKPIPPPHPTTTYQGKRGA